MFCFTYCYFNFKIHKARNIILNTIKPGRMENVKKKICTVMENKLKVHSNLDLIQKKKEKDYTVWTELLIQSLNNLSYVIVRFLVCILTR